MTEPFIITTHTHKRASQIQEEVQIGHYFVFVKQQKASSEARFKRLLVEKPVNRVLPLVEKPVELNGITITPDARTIDPIGCVVSDRDLYRAEQDTVHLFIAFPAPPDNLYLNIDCNGASFTQRQVQLTNGVGIETLFMLLPGRYEAHLSIADRRLGTPISFTVAEYTLAPLSARLLSHRLKREAEQLWFELAVESYQKPFAEELLVTLVGNGQEIAQIGLIALSPGRYAGGINIQGKGLFRLRLMAANDAERVAEVAILGSRQVERQVTVISELGLERCFSMMPEQSAIPLRGGYLTAGDFMDTPLTVDEIVTEQRLIHVNTDLESVVLVSLDLTSGFKSVQNVGDITAGNTMTVMNDSPMSLVFIGGFVNGQPFEGYTTFIKPNSFQLTVDAPKTIRPRTDLVVHITSEGIEDQTIPVLLCIRDERLTATDKPTERLGAAAKRGIEAATEGMNERTFTSITEMAVDIEFDEELREEIDLYLAYENFEQARSLMESAIEKYPQHRPYHDKLEEINSTLQQNDKDMSVADVSIAGTAAAAELQMDNLAMDDELLSLADDDISMLGDDLDLEDELSLELSLDFDEHAEVAALELAEVQTEELEIAAPSSSTPLAKDSTVAAEITINAPASDSTQEKYLKKEAITEPSRANFPEVLFYDIVPVSGTTEVVIPLSDALSTFTIEAFALTMGDWVQTQTSVSVDQPVRVDLELPTAVHPDDKVIGHLHALTRSLQARITLVCDGKPVTLCNGNPIDALSIDTPIELAFYVKSGTYIATVADSLTGETDSIEIAVDETGQFKSYPKELRLLVKDEFINLETALSLQVLPTIDTSFDSLITATAGYAHLCCEQTAAKILAATFMYLTAKNAGQRRTAEQIIHAGIAREQKMIRPGQGFAMYPNADYISTHYSMLTVHYLWKLNQLYEMPEISNHLRQAVRAGLSLAEQAAKAHHMQRMPSQIKSIEDAYMLATASKKTAAVRQFIEKTIDFSRMVVKSNPDAVANRKILAYAAASLIALNDLERGIKLANQVTRQFNEQGMLYSTLDSVAAIALMIQLRKSGIVTNQARVRVNGQEMTALEAAQLTVRVESIEVLEGVAAVEVTRLQEEDWGSVAGHFPVQVEFRDRHDQPVQGFKVGDRTDLVISLPKGYQTGDLVHVALPACLSSIQGGGKVKRFTLDFEGEDELRIPLVVTSKIEGQQHFAVCVRNMFEEERVTSPGILVIEGK